MACLCMQLTQGFNLAVYSMLVQDYWLNCNPIRLAADSSLHEGPRSLPPAAIM